MKGKNIFTTSEVNKIKKLIAEKVEATPSKQKGIRNKIRELGFYYSDFSSQKDGYTVEDFNGLIRSGKIKEIGDTRESIAKPMTKTSVTIQPLPPMALSSEQVTDLSALLQIFKQNRFDPATDDGTIIPDKSGNYILCLKPNSNLPTVSIVPNVTNFDGLKVVYTGIAGGSLRNRDYRQHFTGNNAGRSTLRKSLGVLFGYKQISRDKDPSNGKTKFCQTDEEKLTKWMINNLVMYFFPTTDFDSIEIMLINHFNPPLNIKDNHNFINADFRKLLSTLRSQK
jgi:hypothetical protein